MATTFALVHGAYHGAWCWERLPPAAARERVAAGDAAGWVVDHGDGTSSWRLDAVDVFYHDCSAADAAWAASRLRRQASRPSLELCPLAALPEVECSYVLCRDDRVLAPDW